MLMRVFSVLVISFMFFRTNGYPQDAGEDGGGDSAPTEEPVAVPDVIPPPAESDEQQPTTIPPPECNIVGMIKCFTDYLDDWMLYLWNFKENIVTINQTACEHHREMGFCVSFPGCSKSEAINASRVITDLILHRQRSGSFLKSYYFTHFACSDEGKEIVTVHRECLKRSRLNEKTIYLSHYMEDKVECMSSSNKNFTHCRLDPNEVADQDNWYCGFLTSKASDLYEVAKEECTSEPAYLMCKSLTDIFINLFPELFQNCQVPCAQKPPVTPDAQNGLSTSTTLGAKSIYTVSPIFNLTFFMYILSSLVSFITCRVH